MPALHMCMRMPPAAAAPSRRGGRAAATAASAPRLPCGLPPLRPIIPGVGVCSGSLHGMGQPLPPALLRSGAPHGRPAAAAFVMACVPESSSGEPPEVQARKQGPCNVTVSLGTGSKVQVQLPATATIRDLKNQLQQPTGLEPTQQKLLVGSKSALPDTTTLGSLAAAELSDVVLVTRVHGG